MIERAACAVPPPQACDEGEGLMIVDAHNDLLLELGHRAHEENPFGRHWLPKLRAGGVELQVCPIYVDFDDLPELGLRGALKLATAFHRAARENAADVAVVRTTADIDSLDGRIGLLLSFEGAEPLGYDLSLLDTFWELGLRMVGLTYNRRNPFADGMAEQDDGGLSNLGRALVDRLAERGVMIDLAHASDRTFWDVLEHAPKDATVIVSHANCRALVPTPRNLSDEQLRALAEHGGVLGILAHPYVVQPGEPTIDRLIDHVDHAVSVMGIEHVAIGGDFIRQVKRSGAVRVPTDALLPDGMAIDATIEGLAGPDDYPALVTGLRARGYEGERLGAILRGNWLRVFRDALA